MQMNTFNDLWNHLHIFAFHSDMRKRKKGLIKFDIYYFYLKSFSVLIWHCKIKSKLLGIHLWWPD